MEETLKKILEELQSLNNRVGNLEEGLQDLQNEVKVGFESTNKKLDVITA